VLHDEARMHTIPTIDLIDLDDVTGGGLRSFTYGALTALSVATGNPSGEKMQQPNLSPAPVVQMLGPKK
jgi:hypothetical protein